MVQESGAGHVQGDALQVRENKVVVGEWSGDLMQLAVASGQVRSALRAGQHQEARVLVQAHSVEEQAALVVMDENPEEVLALTSMDERGRPGYKTEVVEVLPAEVLTDLIAPRAARHGAYNVEVIRTMSSNAFQRTVYETLDPLDNPELRTQVSWEWLEAVAALRDPVKAGELLNKVDMEMLEDAIIERLGHLDLNSVISEAGASVSVFRLFSESGGAMMMPEIEDAEIGAVINALHDADPALMAAVVRQAWERAEGRREQ